MGVVNNCTHCGMYTKCLFENRHYCDLPTGVYLDPEIFLKYEIQCIEYSYLVYVAEHNKSEEIALIAFNTGHSRWTYSMINTIMVKSVHKEVEKLARNIIKKEKK